MPEVSESRYLVNAGWDDVPHLTEAAKRKLLASTPPYLRGPRSKGIPSIGEGAIFPIEVDLITYKPFPLPSFWPRAYGLDVGWKRTACVWGAWDRSCDVMYLYAEHYRGQAEPSTHAAAIKARGDWIPGVVDPAAQGRSQKDGEQLIALYRENGLNLEPANNAVEAGLGEMWQRFETGRLKVSKHMVNWLMEYRLYSRDKNGKIVKRLDHALDASRYLVMSGMKRAIVEPARRIASDTDAFDRKVGY